MADTPMQPGWVRRLEVGEVTLKNCTMDPGMHQGRPSPRINGKCGLGRAWECTEMIQPGRPETYEHIPKISVQDLGDP